MPDVTIKDLSVTFRRRNGEPLVALDSVSFTVRQGELVSFVGPSGCGKTTLLNVVAGLVPATKGVVDVGGSSQRPIVAYCFQSPRLLNWRNVRQNIEFALEARGIPRRQWAERADRYLDLVGLGGFADEFPLALSGGMQQRVAIARALSVEPDILLMDEPFSALDELTARSMRTELLRIWEATRRTVFFVTHNAHEAAFLSDRVAIMSKRPARISEFIDVEIARPRDYESPAVLERYTEVVQKLLGSQTSSIQARTEPNDLQASVTTGGEARG